MMIKAFVRSILAGVVGLVTMATPASATVVTETTISGYAASSAGSILFDIPDAAVPYSLVFRQFNPAPSLDDVPNVDHSGIVGTPFQVTWNIAGRAWDWFDVYKPRGDTVSDREFVFWSGSEPLSARDPNRNMIFSFYSGLSETSRVIKNRFGSPAKQEVAGQLDMSTVDLPMTFIDWSSGHPVGARDFTDPEIDLIGSYKLYISCFRDGCPGSNWYLGGVFIWILDVHRVEVRSFEISPIPEPATWSLMLAGLGLTGMALRRRARVAVG
jgi:hypothetical protein